MTTQLWSIITVIICCIIGAFGALFFKLGAEKLNFKIKDQIKNYKLFLGFVFYSISTLMFIFALKGGELSVLYPLVGTTYIWINLLSIKYLNEQMNKYKWTGIMLIIIGVSLIGLGSK